MICLKHCLASLVFGLLFFWYVQGELCRDKSIWCPQMATHGACGYHNQTRSTCPRRCGLCSPECGNVTVEDRRECGHFDITSRNCERRGCCFAPAPANSQSKHVPWCFYPNGQCEFVEGGKRRDCGYLGVTRDLCLDRGCCWSPLDKDSKHPWCHHTE